MGHCKAFSVLYTGCEHLISQGFLCSKTAESTAHMEVPRLSTKEEAQYRKEDMLREEEIVLICSVMHCLHITYKRHTYLRVPEDVLTM